MTLFEGVIARRWLVIFCRVGLSPSASNGNRVLLDTDSCFGWVDYFKVNVPGARKCFDLLVRECECFDMGYLYNNFRA